MTCYRLGITFVSFVEASLFEFWEILLSDLKTFFSLNRPTGPIQSISCNVHLCVCVVCAILFAYFYVLLLSFAKIESQIDQLQKESLGKSYEMFEKCSAEKSKFFGLQAGTAKHFSLWDFDESKN